MIKIVFLDFDNTLYSHKLQCIPQSAISSLQNIRDKGVKVFLATGRSLNELNKFNLSGFKYDGMIALNGQLIYDENNKIIKANPIKNELKEKIINIFNEKKIPTSIVHLDEIYINYHDDFILEAYNKISTKCPPIKEINKNKDFYMVCMFAENEEHKKIISELNSISSVTRWSATGYDVIEKNVSKASAVKEVLNYYKISKEEAISFGDEQNDLEMMLTTGTSVAVGNASDEIKEKATYVTDDITNNGIANAIKKYFN